MANVVHPFEEILQFEGANSQPPQRALACVRCHSQKLRCVRSNDNTVCDRCLSADAECIPRRPQRLGRPSESHVSSSNHALTRRRQRMPAAGRSRQDKSHQLQLPESPALHDAFGTTNNTSNTSPATPSLTAPAAAGPLLLSPSSLSAGSSNVWTWLNTDTPDPNMPVDRRDVDERIVVSQAADVSGYRGPVTAMGCLSTLLPDFDDLPPEAFDPKLLRTPPEPLGGGNSAGGGVLGAQELVSGLAQLQLDLHLCLGNIRSLDATKRAMVLSEGGGRDGGSSGSTTPSNHSTPSAESVEHAFKVAESFLDLLNALAQSDSGIPTPSSNQSLPRNGSGSLLFELTPTQNASDTLDMSTRLMVTSCYTKLLQIFEVLVSLLQVSQASHRCSLSSVCSLKIGNFSPATNKDLAVGLLTQYMLHLLDGISAAVENTSCMVGLNHVAKETKKVEAKLREQISTARQSILW